MRRAVGAALVLGAAVAIGVAMRGPSPADPGPAAVAAGPTGAKCVVRQVAGLYVPDPVCTPGALDDAVTKDGPPYKDTLYLSTICKPGWATAQRKALFPLSASERVKAVSVREYGAYAGASLRGYELDHLIPISLGGAIVGTTSAHPNLWPETQPKQKDRVESAAGGPGGAVCQGRVTLAHAQDLMAKDWVRLGEILGVVDVAGGRAVPDPLAPTGGSD